MAETGRKLVLIGAGSVTFSRGLMADLIASRDCGITRVALVDINGQAAETILGIARRMAAGRRDDLCFEAATDRRAALPGADYVVTTFAVGGWRGRQLDLQIPRSHGLYLPVGDTVGPAGVSRVLRHIPVMDGIARDIDELCPDAWLFNFANPLSTLVRTAGLARRTRRTVGLCHGLPDRAKRLAAWAGLPRDGLDLDCGGLNHCTWITRLASGGEDVLARIRAKLDAEGPGGWLAENPFTVELFDVHGAMVVPGDRHVTEFYPQLFRDGYYGNRRLGLEMWPIGGVLAGQQEQIEILRQESAGTRALDPKWFERKPGDHESLLNIVSAIANDRGEVYTANVPNDGIVPDMPATAVVEVPLRFGRDGYQAARTQSLPAGVVAHQTQRALQMELNVQAALSGSRQTALQALLEDGWVTSVAGARRLLDELLEAHREHLPRFFG